MSDLEFLSGLTQHRKEAAAHAEMGAQLPSGTRFRRIKAALLRGSSLFAKDQVRYNGEILAIAEIVATELNRLREVESELRGALEKVAREREYDRSAMKTLKAMVDRQTTVPGAAPSPALPPQQLLPPLTIEVDDFSDFYREFEDEFRGSKETIRSRQEKYLNDFRSFAGGALPVVDVGCGRGEWLRLLVDNGIPAVGVDTNATFIRMCNEAGLEAHTGDAIEFLERTPPGSLAGLTAFHVVEHIGYSTLLRLVDAAHSAVVPGGVIILETPNPTNIVVGAANFWADVTHLRPVFPRTLAFLVGQRGFGDVELRFLNPTGLEKFAAPKMSDAESAVEMQRIVDHLNGWFFGPEDFAVVARKP